MFCLHELINNAVLNSCLGNLSENDIDLIERDMSHVTQPILWVGSGLPVALI